MPVPDGELRRVLHVDGTWFARDLMGIETLHQAELWVVEGGRVPRRRHGRRTGEAHRGGAGPEDMGSERRLEARFFTASSLVMRLRHAGDNGRLNREAALIGKARLLVINELGFLLLDADGARLLFQVFADAYERQSAAITTNPEFSRWGSVFGDDQMAAAVIDSIVHHGRLIHFRDESYRVRHALMPEG